MGSRANMSTTPNSGCVSPIPEGAAYRHNPYALDLSPNTVDPAYAAAAPEQARIAGSPNVLHTRLSGYVSFVPYPTESYPLHESDEPREQLVRVFVGQLPYRVTPMQLSWLCDTIAPGVQLFHMETIMKKTGMKGKRLPTGCIHALARPQDVDYLIDCMSYRVLFDDTGIWCAQTPEEQEHLQSYCAAMKQNEQLRFRDRPYQPVVVQFATSHYGTSYPPRRASGSLPHGHAPAQYTASPPVSPPAAAYSQPTWSHHHAQEPQQAYGGAYAGAWNGYY